MSATLPQLKTLAAYSSKTSVTSPTTYKITNLNIYALNMEAALTSETYATSPTATATQEQNL
jgi:hypothetical protein